MHSVEIFFLILAAINIPNLFFRAEYNVPLMLFSFWLWSESHFRSTIIYLLLLSWVFDLYNIVIYIIELDKPQTKNFQRSSLVFLLTIITFVLKIGIIIFVVVKDQASRRAVTIVGCMENITKSVRQ